MSQKAECVIDPTLLLKRANGDTNQLKKWIELFLEEYTMQILTIRKAVEKKDCDTIAKAAHSLAGSVVTFEAPKAVESARHLEQMCKNGDHKQIEHTLHTFLSEMAAAKRALSNVALAL